VYEDPGEGLSARHWIQALVLVAVMAGAFAATAMAGVTYAGPKTWLPGYAGNTGYDNSGNRWYYNDFHKSTVPAGRTTFGLGRIAFIKSDGSWAVEVHNHAQDTYYDYIQSGVNFNYQKKAYCENNDSVSYVGYCFASATAP
jgi:hypothetical protein